MEGQSSVECGSQSGSDVESAHRLSRRQRHQLGGARRQHCLDQELHHLGPEDDFLDDEEVSTDDMTADNTNGHRRTSSPADSSMNRKSNKPLMEKKRRQRINRCLNELKTLVLEGSKKDPSRYSKLEKADILEMTVQHVQALHRHEGGRIVGGGRLAAGEEGKYRAGYTHCAAEVAKYLASLNDLPHDLHKKVFSHLNTIATSMSSNVNSNANCVQNSVNVMPNPAPIILVLNTTAGVPVSQAPTQPIAYQETGGNSLGPQPQVTFVTTPRFQTTGGPTPVQQHCGLQILPTRFNNSDLTLVLPATQHVISQSSNTRPAPSAALQASAPVLTAILTSDRNSMSSSFVQPPALSTSSEDSALGTETLDTSDSDISCSGVSTPMSSMSSAGSPAPLEEAGRSSPKRASTSRSSPPLRGQIWNSGSFREELGSSSCPNRGTSSRRQPVLAPKPSYGPWPSRSAPQEKSQKIPKDRSPAPPPPADPQSMWRPWH